MTTENIAGDLENLDRDRAAEARIGGHLLTHFLPARGWSTDTLTLTVKARHYSATDAPTMLPEAAFAWPIYNAVHALRYVTPDWPRPAFPRG